MFGSYPDQHIIDRRIRFQVKDYLTRYRVSPGPELWLIHQIYSIWQWQWRVEQKVFKRAPIGTHPTFQVDTATLTLPAPPLVRDGFGKVIKHLWSLLPFWSLTVYAAQSPVLLSAPW